MQKECEVLILVKKINLKKGQKVKHACSMQFGLLPAHSNRFPIHSKWSFQNKFFQMGRRIYQKLHVLTRNTFLVLSFVFDVFFCPPHFEYFTFFFPASMHINYSG